MDGLSFAIINSKKCTCHNIHSSTRLNINYPYLPYT